MFSFLLKPLELEIGNIKRVLSTHQMLRAYLSSCPSLAGTDIGNLEVILHHFRQNSPGSAEWRVFDHCAALARLYALYETFVRELLGEWLLRVPKLFHNYSDLSASVRNAHRKGVAEVLSKKGGEKGGDRFSHLSDEVIIRGFANGISSISYQLLPELFILDEQNYRHDIIKRVFARCGIEDAWSWVSRHGLVQRYLAEVRGNASSAESELREFIKYRNVASHDRVDNILGAEELRKIADFVLILSGVLAELVMKTIVSRLVSQGRLHQIGEVIRKFSDNVIGVRFQPGLVISGEPFWVQNETACFQIDVSEIQVNGVSQNSSFAFEGRNLGLKVSREAKVGSAVFRPISM